MTRKEPSLPTGVYRSGAKYQYRITFPRRPDGTRPSPIVRGGFAEPWQAKQAREDHRMRLGIAVDADSVQRGDVTVQAWMERWLARQTQLETSSAYQYELKIKHITTRLGHLRLRELTPALVDDWVMQVTKDVSAATARDTRWLLRRALTYAVRLQILPTNPTDGTEPPVHIQRRDPILDPREVPKFLEAALEEPDAALYYTGIMMQPRPGEIIGLQWAASIDHKAQTMAFYFTRRAGRDGKVSVQPGNKTPQSRRVLEMPDVLDQLLKDHRKAQVERILQMPPGVWQDNDLVFPNSTGQPLSLQMMAHRLEKLCKRAGVTVITPKQMRHSGATWMRSEGITPETIARRLGHKDVAMLYRTYSREIEDEQRDASDHLNNIIKPRFQRDAG